MTSKEPTDGELLHELLVRNHIPPLYPPHDGHLDQAAAEFSRPYRERIAELEKRLAESAAAPTVDGKTPGQVNHDVWLAADEEANTLEKMDACWDIAALAVLRVFGQPSQTTQDAAKALRNMRDAIDRIERMSNDTEYGKQWASVADMLEAIDDEIAKLEAKLAPTSDHAHEIGSCSYCDKGGVDHDERKP